MGLSASPGGRIFEMPPLARLASFSTSWVSPPPSLQRSAPEVEPAKARCNFPGLVFMNKKLEQGNSTSRALQGCKAKATGPQLWKGVAWEQARRAPATRSTQAGSAGGAYGYRRADERHGSFLWAMAVRCRGLLNSL